MNIIRRHGWLLGLIAGLIALNGFLLAKLSLQPATLPSLAPVLSRSIPAVVDIRAVSYRTAPRHPLQNDLLFQHFLEIPGTRQQQREFRTLGAGIIVDAAKGLILVSYHVIEEAQDITVTLHDEREFNAVVIGTDTATDVAVIKINADNLQALPFADSDTLRVGDFVAAIGNPFGLRHSATLGIVSGVNRSGIGYGNATLLQTDAMLDPGNSGGALVNLNGDLVGLNTFNFSRGHSASAINFAVPANTLKALLTEVVNTGLTQRGRLGFFAQKIDPGTIQQYRLPRTQGVLLTRVLANSPAAQAGLQAGDILLSINQEAISSIVALSNVINRARKGDSLKIDVLRKNERYSFTLQMEIPGPTEMAGGQLHPSLSGAELLENQDNPGILIRNVNKGTAAWNARLQAGDIILEVNQQPVNDLNSLQQSFTQSQTGRLLLLVQSGNRAYYVTIQ